MRVKREDKPKKKRRYSKRRERHTMPCENQRKTRRQGKSTPDKQNMDRLEWQEEGKNGRFERQKVWKNGHIQAHKSLSAANHPLSPTVQAPVKTNRCHDRINVGTGREMERKKEYGGKNTDIKEERRGKCGKEKDEQD